MIKALKSVFACFLLFLLVSCVGHDAVLHTIEKITFQSDQFHLVGELRLPKEGDKHPLVIMVHGDGPAYRTYFFKLKECFLRAGYATLMWDKPGCGQSKGELSKNHLREERAKILVDAIDQMKTHPRIDAEHMGVWGISQAGYVIPMALLKTNDISFMIMVGCPGENGIHQTAYLIRRQLQFEGVSEEEARQAESHFAQLFYAQTFDQYIEHAKPLYDNPVQREMGFVSALWNETNWKPHSPEDEGFFNPMDIIEKITIPVLAFFGEKDTQVDPIQGVSAYKKALTEAGNKNFRVELIPNADHNIILSKTGRRSRSSKEWQNYAPEYLKIMEDWLKQLNK
jgi:pimeloyl-ACP methyl ester carboxylesterase